MRHERLQKRMGWLIVCLGTFALASVIWDRLWFQHAQPQDLILDLSVQMNLFTILVFTVLTLWNHRYARWAMAFVVFLLSAPVLLSSGSRSFFGLSFVVSASLLFLRFGMLERFLLPKVAGILAWTFGFILLADEQDGTELTKSLSTFAFLLVSLIVFYILFEEEIRDLIASNKKKDAELAEQAAEIARLEPLSVLGERVAHVAHSFKNNLSLLGTARFHLEEGKDPLRAAQKVEEFARSMNERIDNILMVSRAGADQTAEHFDAARVLSGLNQVYLTEPAFLRRAKVKLEAPEPTPVYAVRWDFLLLAENILKNALEALTSKGGYGNIQVTLKDRVLTLANDGGAMTLCNDCQENCLHCPRYGRPGRTTKVGGTGHGLAQVFSTCRKYGWTLRIQADQDWTIFRIGLPLPERVSSAPAPVF